MTLTSARARSTHGRQKRPESGWLDLTREAPPTRGRAPAASSRAVPAGGGTSTEVPPLT